MDATPSLPPYAHVSQEAVQCAAQASVRYGVPELLLHSVMMREGGRTGQCSKNKNGTYDCGLNQINTTWFEHFKRLGVPPQYLVHDACTNIQAAAYILKTNFLQKNQDWFPAIVAYNIGPNNWTKERYAIGYRYAVGVVNYWWGFQRWVQASQQQAQIQAANQGRVAGTEGLVFAPE